MKIAIDGPAGSGKSTVAKLVAKKLAFKHIDTGAYYRWLTANVLKKQLDPADPQEILSILPAINFQDIPEQEIRTRAVTNTVSQVSAHKQVRPFIVEKQRETARQNNVVMEGRDIGSVVFPDAEVKIFLNASVDERAKRRYQELIDKKESVDLSKIKEEIILRDKLDSERESSPLIKTADAIEIDTTGLSINEVVDKILEIVKNKL